MLNQRVSEAHAHTRTAITIQQGQPLFPPHALLCGFCGRGFESLGAGFFPNFFCYFLGTFYCFWDRPGWRAKGATTGHL